MLLLLLIIIIIIIMRRSSYGKEKCETIFAVPQALKSLKEKGFVLWYEK